MCLENTQKIPKIVDVSMSPTKKTKLFVLWKAQSSFAHNQELISLQFQ